MLIEKLFNDVDLFFQGKHEEKKLIILLFMFKIIYAIIMMKCTKKMQRLLNF